MTDPVAALLLVGAGLRIKTATYFSLFVNLFYWRKINMNQEQSTRRDFLKSSFITGGLGVSLFTNPEQSARGNFALKNSRPNVAVIGTGWLPDIKRQGRGLNIGKQVTQYADVVVICDVDRVAAEFGCDYITKNKAEIYEDYRDVLARKDIDAVLVATPDHWHTKISIDAMRAGKDVYCEKPLTLTVDEGKKICKAVEETKKVFQVGTQQRSENQSRFLTAIAMVQSGRIGQVKKVTVGIDQGLTGGPFKATEPPPQLNWDLWLGQAPKVPYIKERTHWTFRWWYEYSGGKLTDWGAHHVDIAQWAIGMDKSGPVSIEGKATFPQPMKNGFPTRLDTYNMPVDFDVYCKFPNGIPMHIHSKNNGILFEGEKGRFFVNRNRLVGSPAEDLKKNPIPEELITKLYKGGQPGSHMKNFIDCLSSRELPVSDVYTHHRTLSTCHLSNIALRLGRKLEWDPENEVIVNDSEANGMLARKQRKGFEIS